MRGKELLDKMELAAPEYIEAAEGSSKAESGWIKWAAAAACICIVTAAAVLLFPNAAVNVPDSDPIYGSTSDTYADLPSLLAYLGKNESHDGKNSTDGRGVTTDSQSAQPDSAELMMSACAVVEASDRYSYHITRNAVMISLLESGGAKNAGSIEGSADGLFVSGSHLIVVSQFISGGEPDALEQEMSVRLSIYDISEPEKPVLKEEYVQLGSLAACWMSGGRVYLTTSDGVCACGWSRLSDASDYYPSLSHGGVPVAWGDEDISILGEPSQIRYLAITAIDAESGEIAGKKALYGDVLKLYYGGDWLAVNAAGISESYRENPVLYTFGGNLEYTGKISTAQITGAPEKLECTDYVSEDGSFFAIVSVARVDGVYRLLGMETVTENGETAQSYFVAMTARTDTGETQVKRLSKDGYVYGMYTEIMWEQERAVICVSNMYDEFPSEGTGFEARFIFAMFDGLNITFLENDLTADFLNGRLGLGYGSPLGNFETLINMGNGVYVRYAKPTDGPTGFDLFDFSDSAEPRLLYRGEALLETEQAYDYAWLVYDEHTFGTLKVTLNGRKAALSWCIFTINTNGQPALELQKEYQLGEAAEAFCGADDLGFAVFEAGGSCYCVTYDMESAAKLG